MDRDVLIIGAGPIGLACGIECQRRGLDYAILEKGTVVNSVYHFPQNMTFFSTAPELEIGGVPFIVSGDKPKRVDALRYYWRVAKYFDLRIFFMKKVDRIECMKDRFLVHCQDQVFSSKTVILAIGYYDQPNLLNVPGEEMPHVSHYYSDPHRHIGQRVVVVGGNNSAAEAALELYRYGIDVTLVHRGKALGRGLKYWVKPDIENRIKNKEIKAFLETHVERIEQGTVWLRQRNREFAWPADSVLALTGYHPNFDFMRRAGIEISETGLPLFDPATGETNVPGLYIAGALQAGTDANKIFIENGRLHAPIIAEAIAKKLS